MVFLECGFFRVSILFDLHVFLFISIFFLNVICYFIFVFYSLLILGYWASHFGSETRIILEPFPRSTEWSIASCREWMRQPLHRALFVSIGGHLWAPGDHVGAILESRGISVLSQMLWRYSVFSGKTVIRGKQIQAPKFMKLGQNGGWAGTTGKCKNALKKVSVRNKNTSKWI